MIEQIFIPMAFKYLFLPLVLSLFFSAPLQAASCKKLLSGIPKKLDNSKMTMVWYTPIEFGDYDAWVSRDPKTGIRRMLSGTFISHGRRFHRSFTDMNLEFMPDAKDNQAAYYGKGILNLKNEDLTLQLFSLDSEKIINKEINKHLELVWKTYLQAKTVKPEEIEDFKKQEAKLAPQRKMTFVVLETKTGKTLSVMRVYDGSPFPSIYFGDFGMFYDYRNTDPRMPIEYRYPKLNFREDTDYVFEGGRLAKDAAVDSALDRQLIAFAGHLRYKYGHAGVAPKNFLDGRVYIEITGRNLKIYLRDREKGGYGFKLFKAIEGKTRQDSKYILYMSVFDFINNFYESITLKPAQETHPDIFK